jgi:small subunit ribosomal protein S5
MPTEVKSMIVSQDLELSDKLMNINRVTKVVKGGKRLSFTVLMVTGDGQGHVGLGVGKAKEVPAAINKAATNAKKRLIKVKMAGHTIPHQSTVNFGAAKVLLKPAAPGTGVVAGGSVRAVVEAAGIKDILTKSLSSPNQINVAKATMLGLSLLRIPKEEVARRKAGLEKEGVSAGG